MSNKFQVGDKVSIILRDYEDDEDVELLTGEIVSGSGDGWLVSLVGDDGEISTSHYKSDELHNLSRVERKTFKKVKVGDDW